VQPAFPVAEHTRRITRHLCARCHYLLLVVGAELATPSTTSRSVGCIVW
jgi:hypothetical protein